MNRRGYIEVIGKIRNDKEENIEWGKLCHRKEIAQQREWKEKGKEENESQWQKNVN